MSPHRTHYPTMSHKQTQQTRVETGNLHMNGPTCRDDSHLKILFSYLSKNVYWNLKNPQTYIYVVQSSTTQKRSYFLPCEVKLSEVSKYMIIFFTANSTISVRDGFHSVEKILSI